MKIYFRTTFGKPYILEVSGPTSVSDIKTMLSKKFGFNTHKTSLLFGNIVLNNSTILDPSQLEDTFVVIHESINNHKMVRSILSQSIPHQISRQETTTPQQTQIQSIQQNGIPPDFDEHVRMLVDQGFDKAKVIEFFQAANYDYDTTYFALVHDRKPEDKPKKKIIPVESEIEMKPEELKVHDEDADVSELDKYDFGPHKKHLDKMTNQEKAGLLDIIKAFPQTEPSVVLQFYVSCEKNFSTTKEIMNKNGLV